ncbi:ADP-ribosylation factor 2 [Porphyridium purpureum]|uniref:ADP-ribosylation factor 2 n=1 Tax=Porphyridium purpureum TaxID=35688 RepID=A0A5J4YGH4_PORPP|nr:ADP-ribosylation factor 2 [Porphyridium purpureum]|eukprot:POR8407..scf255_21
MGCFSSKEAGARGRGGSKSVLFLGLDGSGSTTVMYQLVLGRKVDTIPTLGFNKEVITYNGIELEMFDLGGVEKVRPVWRQYAPEADAIVFVVDGHDEPRVTQAKGELEKFLAELKDKSIPLLLFVNKNDLPGYLGVEAVEEKLNIKAFAFSAYKAVGCCGKTGDEIKAGMDWLTDQLKSS